MKNLFTFLFLFAIAFSVKAQFYQTCENFDSIQADTVVYQNGWTTYNEAGSHEWRGKTYSGNGYAQMTAFGGDTLEIDWLISPAFPITPNPVKSLMSFFIDFETKDGYFNGAPLEFLVSSDYDGTNMGTATWTNFSNMATFAFGDSNAYGSAFVASNPIEISSCFYGGNYFYLAFKYTGGSNGITTTMQLDNICFTMYSSITEQNIETNTFYPNPAQDQIVINTTDNCELVEIYSISGQKVMSLQAQEQMNINIESLYNGIYFIKFINSDNTSTTSKFIKN